VSLILIGKYTVGENRRIPENLITFKTGGYWLSDPGFTLNRFAFATRG